MIHLDYPDTTASGFMLIGRKKLLRSTKWQLKAVVLRGSNLHWVTDDLQLCHISLTELKEMRTKLKSNGVGKIKLILHGGITYKLHTAVGPEFLFWVERLLIAAGITRDYTLHRADQHIESQVKRRPDESIDASFRASSSYATSVGAAEEDIWTLTSSCHLQMVQLKSHLSEDEMASLSTFNSEWTDDTRLCTEGCCSSTNFPTQAGQLFDSVSKNASDDMMVAVRNFEFSRENEPTDNFLLILTLVVPLATFFVSLWVLL